MVSSRALRDFHKRLCEQLDRFQAQRKKELEEFEQRQRAQMGAFNESLKKVSREFRPPGARARADAGHVRPGLRLKTAGGASISVPVFHFLSHALR